MIVPRCQLRITLKHCIGYGKHFVCGISVFSSDKNVVPPRKSIGSR